MMMRNNIILCLIGEGATLRIALVYIYIYIAIFLKKKKCNGSFLIVSPWLQLVATNS